MKKNKKLLWANIANWGGVFYKEPFQLQYNRATKTWNSINRTDGHMAIHEIDLKINKPFYNKVYATHIFVAKARTRVISWMDGVNSMQTILLDMIPPTIKENGTIGKTRS